MRVAIGLIAVLVLGVSCSDSGPTVACEGEGADLWDCRGLQNYDLTVTRSCFCFTSGRAVEVQVRGGLAVGARFADTGEAIPEDQGLWTTVDDLLRTATADYEAGYDVSVDYDPELGYPTRIDIQCEAVHADCSIGIVAHVIPRPVALPR